MAMQAHDPDSVFEPIEGMRYVGTTKSRRSVTVRVLKVSPQTVLYMPVGRGAKERKVCKSSRSKFIHCHEPAPGTPLFATVVAAEGSASAGASVLAVPVVETPPPAPTQEAPQEAPVPATAPVTPADPPKRKPPGRYGPEEVREMYLLAVDIPPGKSRTAHQEEVAATYGCSETLIDNIVRGKSHAAVTADLRAARAALAATRPLALVPRAEAPAEALPKAPAGPPARPVVAAGHATVAVPRHGDGPPPPPGGRAEVGEAAKLLSDSAELIQTMARCIVKRRPLPSYLSLKTIEEIADRCDDVAERLTEVARAS